MQMTGIALVLRPGPEAGDAAALVVGVKGQVQADGIVDAAQETHARVRLFFHDVVSNRYGISLCCLNYSIDAGFGQHDSAPKLVRSWPFCPVCDMGGANCRKQGPPLLVNREGFGPSGHRD
jgi:hypothetical protein